MAERCDIAIVGAGIAGATLAALLAEGPWSVVLLDGAPPPRPGARPGLRVSALTRASEEVFVEAGAWGAMAGRAGPIRAMRVWEDGVETVFDSAEIGEPHLGHIVENDVVVAALLARLADSGRVAHRPGVAVVDLAATPRGPRLGLAGGAALEARLVVAADGAASPVRRLAGIPFPGWSYGQHALVARVTTAAPHRQTAWQRFLPGGPLAFLPLADGASSIVWSLPSPEARRLAACEPPDFEAELTEAFQGRLGQVALAGGRAIFPLAMRHAQAYWREGIALIGDAAHRIHPLAGQGANLGVGDAGALAECLLAGHAAGRAPGHPRDLGRWARWRRESNLQVMAAMEGFAQLFGPLPLPLAVARRWGMGLFGALGPVKRWAMRRASGLAGDLPRAARPHYDRDPCA